MLNICFCICMTLYTFTFPFSDNENFSFRTYTYTYIHTYIIGYYNPSVRITLASHTTHVVCVNFIHEWRHLQFNVDSERQIFDKALHGSLEIC